jgi:hypothetical protein
MSNQAFQTSREKMIQLGWTTTNNEAVFISKDKKLIGRLDQSGKLIREKNVRKQAKVIQKANGIMSNSQIEAVIEFLQTGETLNLIQSWELFGIYRLAAVIDNIKEQGFEIFKKSSLVENNLGEFTYVAEYSLCEFDDAELEDEEFTRSNNRNHEQTVLEALNRGSELNSIVAMEEYGIMHLAAVIKNLRKKMHIESAETEIVSPNGDVRYFDSYYTPEKIAA